MNQTILVALIGTTGIIVGAILTFLASPLTAQLKIKEIAITYQQKLDEIYLSNARLYIDTVYLPLNISLTKLVADYRRFKRCYQAFYQPKLFYLEDELSEEEEKQELAKENEQVIEEFRRNCRHFLEQISELTNQGKDAFLTVKLDEGLQSFADFLEWSMFGEIPIIEPKTTKRFHITDKIQHRFRHVIKHRPGKKGKSDITIWLEEPSPRNGLSIHNSFNILREVVIPDNKTVEGKVLKAPITSSLFEERFSRDIRVLKSCIKEVTLGAISSNKTN